MEAVKKKKSRARRDTEQLFALAALFVIEFLFVSFRGFVPIEVSVAKLLGGFFVSMAWIGNIIEDDDTHDGVEIWFVVSVIALGFWIRSFIHLFSA